MRFLAASLLLAIVVTGCSKGTAPRPAPRPAEPPALLARYHFVGTAAVAADPNAAKLTSFWALPATRPFASNALGKLADGLRALWHPQAPTNADDHIADLRPLLEELLQAESCGEAHGASTGTAELVLAVRLPDDRATTWSATLARIATNWTAHPADPLTKPGGGWQIKKANSPKVFQFGRAGGWVVIGVGDENLATFDAALERAAKQELPVEGSRDGWLTATIDLPKLARRATFDSPVKLGTVQLTAFGRDENVRFEGSIRYESPLGLNLSEWRVPVSSIHDPLTGFTVIRGLAGLLTRTNWTRDWEMTNVPNQLVSWAMADVPYQVLWAALWPGPTNLLAALEPRLNSLARSNLTALNMATVKYDATNDSLRAEGLPFISPFAMPVQDNGQSYVLTGLFPGFTNSGLAPRELFSAFQNRTNLVYYDWEITDNRLYALRHISQLFCMVAGRPQAPQAPEKAPGWNWIPEVAPLLGETVTTISLQSPTELRFTRRGHLGLTGAEITLLVRLLDSPGFPLSPWTWLERDPAAFAPRPRPQATSPEKNP